MCTHCNTRPGTVIWTGTGGALAYVHGAYTLWCERCVIEAQLTYAREQAAKIPALEAQLAALQD